MPNIKKNQSCESQETDDIVAAKDNKSICIFCEMRCTICITGRIMIRKSFWIVLYYHVNSCLEALKAHLYNSSKSNANIFIMNAQTETILGAHHGDVIKWKHFLRHWPFVPGIHRSPVNSPHKGQWLRALMFSLIYAWIHSWVNNHEADDLRCHRAHYDVIVLWCMWVCMCVCNVWM